MSLEAVLKSLDTVEKNLSAMSEKADGEMKTLGKVTADTKTALDNIGKQQLELADRLTQIEQKGTAKPESKADETWGGQVVKSESLKAFQSGSTQKARIEVKNTLVGSDANVAPDRKPGIVPGAFQMLTMESFLNSLPTNSNAIEYTREASFTNNAAETAEGGAKPESAITWALVNMPVSTVAHWIKISRQLASDNAALAAYVNNRMRYGVNRKVETQLVSGDGTAPNISGILDTGNFTAHGYADADLGSSLKKLVLIRKIMAASWNAGYPADAILLNPIDWAAIEIDLPTAKAHLRLESDYPDAQVQPYLNAAELLAAQFLNRRIYADAGALDTAVAAVPAALLAAGTAYEAAMEAALLITDCVAKTAAEAYALAVYTAAQTEVREIRAGMVTSSLVEAGILLILGHLFENRQENVAGVTVAKLPMGAHHLLQPFRVDMGI